MVVIDDPALLDTFARQAREGRLLVWATRLVVVTRPAPHGLHPLHQTLAVTNSLLLVVDSAMGVTRYVGVLVFKLYYLYIVVPSGMHYVQHWQ